MLSKLNSKNLFAKSIDIQKKKKSVHYLDSNLRPPECNPLSYIAVVFDGMLLEFSPFLRLQAAVEYKLIIALTRGGKLEGGG